MLNPGTEILITDVTPSGSFRLKIRFSDGHVSDVDFEPFLRASKHPDIRTFLDPTQFETYRIEWGNLVWGDYSLCFPLESLYENCLAENRLQAVAEDKPEYGTCPPSSKNGSINSALPASLNDVNRHDDNGNDQQDVNEPAYAGAADQPQQPEYC